jgi:hypothetical protein
MKIVKTEIHCGVHLGKVQSLCLAEILSSLGEIALTHWHRHQAFNVSFGGYLCRVRFD